MVKTSIRKRQTIIKRQEHIFGRCSIIAFITLLEVSLADNFQKGSQRKSGLISQAKI